MSKKRSFEELKHTMKEEQFITFCTKLATQYANSEAQFARSYFTEYFNITASCYTKLLETAVIHNFVTDKMVDKMEKKAIANQNLHSEGAGSTSINHYAELRAKRKNYIVSTFSDEDVIKVINEFDSLVISKHELAEKYNVNTKIIDLIIKKGIVENLVSDEVFARIERRSLEKDNSYETKKFFYDLHQERNSKKATFE